jgi:GntR family transcriptional regulator
MNDKIDRNSSEPVYTQLVNLLRAKIASGEFRPGEKLPSESQLRKKYDLSPMTVRRVINILVDQGVVSTSQGKGTYVKPIDLQTSSFHLEELQKLFNKKDHAEIKLLKVALVSADESIASKLAVRPGDDIIFISRLIVDESEPVILHKEFLIYDPTRPIVESEMEFTTLRGLLMGNGLSDFKKGELTIQPTLLSNEEAELLEVPPSSLAFRLEHIFFDFEDCEVSWGQFLCRSDKLSFRTKVGIWES